MADVFSGRPNPAWVLTDEQEARTILRELAQNRTLVAQAAPPEASLGFRGFFVELLSDELARDVDLPTALYIAVRPGVASAKAHELAERLIGVVTRAEAWSEAADVDTLALDESLQTFLRAQLDVSARTSVLDTESLPGAPTETGSEAVAAAACTIELPPTILVFGTTTQPFCGTTTATTTPATSGPTRLPSPAEGAAACTRLLRVRK